MPCNDRLPASTGGFISGSLIVPGTISPVVSALFRLMGDDLRFGVDRHRRATETIGLWLKECFFGSAIGSIVDRGMFDKPLNFVFSVLPNERSQQHLSMWKTYLAVSLSWTAGDVSGGVYAIRNLRASKFAMIQSAGR